MRRTNGHHMVDARLGFHFAQPGACCQPTHGMAHKQWCKTRCYSDLVNGRINRRDVLVNGAKQRFQINGNKCVARACQAHKPGVPKTAVAKKPVNKNHTALTRFDCVGGDVVGYGV